MTMLLPAGLRTALLAAVFSAAPLLAAGPTNEDCMTCHEDKTLAREADKRPVFVDAAAFTASVHGKAGLGCVDCHADLGSTTDFPHESKLAKVDCAPCHDQQASDYAKSFHAESRQKSEKSKAARCVDCHGVHDMRSPKDAESSVDHFRLPATCLRCHGDPAVYPKAARLKGNDPAHFADSIHGKALMKSGLTVAPNCATCHGYHEIRRPTDPASSVARPKIPATCGSCHTALLAKFEQGVHGQALKRGDPKAPVCVDCHTAHEVTTAESSTWKLSVVKECGTCHEELIRTYRDTYHGQVTELGFTRVATCADCHNAHDIFAKADPRSTVSDGQRLKTCQKCHPGTGPNFAKYDPHADHENRQRSRVLYYTSRFMKLLLLGVFTFFGIHTALWLPRSWKARAEKGRRP